MSQVENGKAFEYAVAKSFSKRLNIEIRDTPASRVAASCYTTRPEKLRARFDLAALRATDHIFDLEYRSILQGEDILIAEDKMGQLGDVRDVLISRTNIGVSCKANHEAFKHPRISGKIDFVKKWGLDPNGCSDNYWKRIAPVFSELAQLKKESGGTALWRDQPDVVGDFYMPILDAFTDQLNEVIAHGDPGVAERFIKYFVGNKDFYKVIAKSDRVEVQSFNLNGALATKKTKSASKILQIDDQDGGAFSKTVRFDEGWTFNLRIHNASSRIESSMKFDVQAVGLPPGIYTHHILYGGRV